MAFLDCPFNPDFQGDPGLTELLSFLDCPFNPDFQGDPGLTELLSSTPPGSIRQRAWAFLQRRATSLPDPEVSHPGSVRESLNVR
jgi:hypothetical protein